MGTMAEMLSTPLGVIEWFVYLLAAVMFVIGLHLIPPTRFLYLK